MSRALSIGGIPSREVAPWIEALARVGFVAKGVLYMTIGALAAAAALGTGGERDADSRAALRELLTAPFGRVLVGVIAIGLVGHAAWRIIEGITDPQRRGHDAKAIALRASYIGRGLIHLALAGAAAALVLGRGGGGGGDGEQAQSWSARALAIPGGVLVLWAIAIGLVGYGLWQLYRAYAAKLSRQLQLGGVSTNARRAIFAVSRFGMAARGVVFGMIGFLLGRAAYQHDPSEAGGVGKSLRELFGFGTWFYLAIALGVAAYGVYELINAKYRRIEVV